MELFRLIMRIASGLLVVYSLVVLLRVLLTWVKGPDLGRAQEYIERVTDPYLDWFRRFTFLNIGGVDLSVVAALVVLSILSSITGQLAVSAEITLGWVLAIIVGRTASAVFFFVTLFLILGGVRAIGSFMQVDTSSRFWVVLDQILQPIVDRVVALVARDRILNYQTSLLVFCGTMLATLIVGRIIVALVVSLLRSLPF